MKITIKAKMSNTGTIHDIANEHFDIVINMGNRYNYVIIAPSYYNLGYTRHVAAHSAIAVQAQLYRRGFEGVVIMDKDQNQLDVDFDGNLRRV